MRTCKIGNKLAMLTLVGWNCLAAGAAYAENYTWVGGDRQNPTNWSNAKNWTPRRVPGALDSATINSGATVVANDTINVQDLSVGAGSTLEANAGVRVSDTFAADDATLTGGGSVTVPAGGVLRFTGTTSGNTVALPIENYGAVSWSSGGLSLANFNNWPGATFSCQSNSTLKSSTVDARFSNAGTFIKGSNGTTGVQVTFINTGAVDVQSGKLNFFRNLVENTGTLHLGGGEIMAREASGAKSTIRIKAGGKLDGIGTIDGDVINEGLVAPGNSPGAITILGNYTQTATGTFQQEIGGTIAGTTYDKMAVYGTSYLSGTLNLVMWNGYVPTPGQSFQFMNYYAYVGNFTTINGIYPATNSAVYFTVTQAPSYFVATCRSK